MRNDETTYRQAKRAAKVRGIRISNRLRYCHRHDQLHGFQETRGGNHSWSTSMQSIDTGELRIPDDPESRAWC